MQIENVKNMATALSKLSSAVDVAAASLNRQAPHDEALRARIVSYKEIVRRQRELLQDLETASSQGAWTEVSRLTQLVHNASLLIKVDAGFILSVLKNEELRN